MLRYVVLAVTLTVGMAPWQAFAQDETSLRDGVVKIMSANLEGMRRTGSGTAVARCSGKRGSDGLRHARYDVCRRPGCGERLCRSGQVAPEGCLTRRS